ncbi:tetratricopeptide repeat protein [Peribacillus frigoritolerans]|uniref:tetratricopeptide repeat protein n=1 Tax=Peribacillus frigoritolerans TaxID=450367 RepID=UPI001059A786|nr:tetratricopeptide repeat protein [Peribacillus frigoritolerans]TDL80688.1 tetratricopeptide repeat protein [Peribacillus frigoritolerans]
MNLSYIEETLTKHDYSEAIKHFLEEYREVAEENKLSRFRGFIRSYTDESQLKYLLQVLDASLMEQLGGIIIRDSYRRLKSPLTAIWYCQQLIDENKLIEAEELLKEIEKQELSDEWKEKFYFTMASALIGMRRLKAAFQYMKKCEEASSDPAETLWAYYFLQSGDWDKALKCLEASKKDEKDGLTAYLLLVQHHALQGDAEQALITLEEGLTLYPDFPKLIVEKIRLCYKQKRWTDMEKAISDLHSLTPFHEYKRMVEYYTADSFYEQKEFGKLEVFLAEHTEFKKESHYKNFTGLADHASKMVNFKPVVQKYNYCVPACAEMIFSMFGKTYKQDEIAESVFHVSGSKLSKIIEYFDEKELTSRYFFGNPNILKTLIDLDAAVMINIDYPTTSHVQLLAGYDDNLKVFHVQDPNLRTTHEVLYEDFEQEYGNNGVLSLAVLPEKEAGKLNVLSINEHELAVKLFSMTEVSNKQLSDAEQALLKENLHLMAVSAYVIKYLPGIVAEEILDAAAMYVFEHSKESEYRSLSAAMAYFSVKNNERAMEYLEQLPFKQYLATYWYAKGRLSYNKDDYDGAFEAFAEALKSEPDDHILWGYLALTELNRDRAQEALRYSEIAMDINEDDAFSLINHGIILMEMNEYEKARNLFHSYLKIEKEDGYVWYQRARCDKELGRSKLARRGFQTAIALEPEVPLAYKELSELYEIDYEDVSKAKEILEQGIAAAEDKQMLLHEAGDLSVRALELEQARQFYMQAEAFDPKDVYARISLAALYKEEGKRDQFFKAIHRYFEQFQEDSEFLINAGKLMFAASAEMKEKDSHMDLALSYVEKGILYADANIGEAIEIYVDLVSETPYSRRGLEFLESIREGEIDEFLLISYIGCLYESHGLLEKAKQYLKQAIALKKDDILPFYRLGEIAFKQEDYGEAEKQYKRVLELDPAHEQAMLDLAGIANAREDRKSEKKYLMSAFKVDPYCASVEALLEVLEFQPEIEAFKELLMSVNVEKAFLYDALAHIHGKLGNLKEEEENLNKAFELAPAQFQILHHQVKLWIKQGKMKQAKSQLLTLIMENQENKQLYETWMEVMLGTKSMHKLDNEIKKMKLSDEEKSIVFMNAAAAYERQMQSMRDAYEEMEEQKGWLKRFTNFSKMSLKFGTLIGLYEEALKHDRENVTAVMWYVEFHLDAGLAEDAIKILEQWLRYQWEPDVVYRLAVLYINEFGNVPEKKAVKYLSGACSLIETLLEENEDPDYLVVLGMALLELEEFEESEQALMRAVKIEPAVEKGYFHLARVYEAIEQYSKAEEAIQHAITLNPDNHDNYNQLGLIYRHQNKLQPALEAVEKAVSIEPEDLISLYNRACYLSTLGRYKESAGQLEALYELDEEFVFTEMAEDDEDLESLKEAGYFPKNPLLKR